jgi:tRNA pseudouridine55 synthase
MRRRVDNESITLDRCGTTRYNVTTMQLPPYLTITKQVGETPLAALTRLRVQHRIPESIPLAYAGRLDPMASGILLVLIGDECKVQEKYHRLDKVYTFEILFGITSDTGDVLGRLTHSGPPSSHDFPQEIQGAISRLPRVIELPYPHFSSKTVRGKPLHVWTLEGRLDEITIPTHTSTLFSISCDSLRYESLEDIHTHVRTKIETIPTVTEASKELGKDFRRVAVRDDWNQILAHYGGETRFPIATCTATVSSGTYIRSLAPLIASHVGSLGLAYSIHRTRIGHYIPFVGSLGFWRKTYPIAD